MILHPRECAACRGTLHNGRCASCGYTPPSHPMGMDPVTLAAARASGGQGLPVTKAPPAPVDHATPSLLSLSEDPRAIAARPASLKAGGITLTSTGPEVNAADEPYTFSPDTVGRITLMSSEPEQKASHPAKVPDMTAARAVHPLSRASASRIPVTEPRTSNPTLHKRELQAGSATPTPLRGDPSMERVRRGPAQGDHIPGRSTA